MPDGEQIAVDTCSPAEIQDWDGTRSHATLDTSHRSSNVEADYRSDDASEEVSDSAAEENPVDESVAEDMRKLESNFVGISKRFRLINRIGEGTFSTVYKAEDLQQDQRAEGRDSHDDHSNPRKRRRLGDVDHQKSSTVRPEKKRHTRYVALKKIYVTSSPSRILNELELLYDLRGCRSVCPLITAFRHQDQVVAVLPFFPHTDFRVQYRTFLVADMRPYFSSLLQALHFVHKHDIIHRDIKPTNFLYNPAVKRGVLVDFGLAEREYASAEECLCVEDPRDRNAFIASSEAFNDNRPTGYPKNDSRPARRANRAGTRGFRAPEVLFKCTSQTTKIDIWSVGVILLTMLGRRFPFFHSMDDVDALIEMASIFGRRRMKQAAALHGQVFETTIPTIGEKGYSWEKIVQWSSCVDELTGAERQGAQLLYRLMELDPSKRISAKEALRHEFFTAPDEDDVGWGGDNDKDEDDGNKTEDAGDNGDNVDDGDVADEVQLV